MAMTSYDLLFKILRIALNVDDADDFPLLSGDDWERLYEQADRQTLLGIAYSGALKLKPEKRPPIDLMFQWGGEAESLRGWNKLLNAEAKRLTKFFDAEGFATAILKGQANARLYPKSLFRQPGDIDIWVSGGLEKIVDFLQKKKLIRKSFESAHHIHMVSENPNVDIEVHYKPSSGNLNYFSSKRLLKYLDQEIEHRELVSEGFYVPPMKFALTMQLAHIQRHYFNGGIGIRQLMDYFILLRSSTEADRSEVSSLLKRFGLSHIAGAVMWILHEFLHMDASQMLCKPDASRGEQLLKDVMCGGNFGKYADRNRLKWLFWWLSKRKNSLRHFCFDPMETIWTEIEYWKNFCRNLSVRIRLRKISLRHVDLNKLNSK